MFFDKVSSDICKRVEIYFVKTIGDQRKLEKKVEAGSASDVIRLEVKEIGNKHFFGLIFDYPKLAEYVGKKKMSDNAIHGMLFDLIRKDGEREQL
jgi:hypothetical protein